MAIRDRRYNFSSGCLRAMNDWRFDTTALYRNGILVLLLVSIALIVHNIFGQNGYLASRHQQQELQILQRQILQLKQQNEQLDKENRALKSDPAAIERKAREQMHLAKPGEKIYMLPEKTPANPPPPTDKETSPQP
jgi:cell division protein FtsB